MNEFMHFKPFFTLCEDLLTSTHIIEAYGFIAACCLLWVAGAILLVDAGLASLPVITKSCRKEYRSHVNSLLEEISDSPSSYGNCPIRLSEIALKIEMRFGATLNWHYATIDLLVGSTKTKKKARKALLGENWLAFVAAVPAAERTELYKAAVGLQLAFVKLENQKLAQHRTLVEPLGFNVTAARWNHATCSWSFSYACKVVKRQQGDTDGDIDRFTLDQRVPNWDAQKRAYEIVFKNANDYINKYVERLK